MAQQMLPPSLAEEFAESFSGLRDKTAGQIVGVVFNLFNRIMKSEKPGELVALWRTLDFFSTEIQPADSHRIKAVRKAILDRLDSLGAYIRHDLADEKKHN
jgi:hypothetical protein